MHPLLGKHMDFLHINELSKGASNCWGGQEIVLGFIPAPVSLLTKRCPYIRIPRVTVNTHGFPKDI